VREWAIANGQNPELRIALCGYEAPDHAMPADWLEIAWKANGGYGNQAKAETTGRLNSHRERIWFSPHCLNPQGSLFGGHDLVTVCKEGVAASSKAHTGRRKPREEK
jgi:hypothetical protein